MMRGPKAAPVLERELVDQSLRGLPDDGGDRRNPASSIAIPQFGGSVTRKNTRPLWLRELPDDEGTEGTLTSRPRRSRRLKELPDDEGIKHGVFSGEAPNDRDTPIGVYHLMSLGRSPGTVIGPLSHLADRWQRWDGSDREFFARSGEREHREDGKKVGNVQGLVLFTTPEVIRGEVRVREYLDNPSGAPHGVKAKNAAVPEAVRKHLPTEWKRITGRQNAARGELFWCEVDRGDLTATYSRMVRVVAALRVSGGQGKEMWANVTGGNNVTNLALQLAASLSGEVSRLYYVQAEDGKEACLRPTRGDGYWVELPMMPLARTPLVPDVLHLLRSAGPLPAREIWARINDSGTHWKLLEGLERRLLRPDPPGAPLEGGAGGEGVREAGAGRGEGVRRGAALARGRAVLAGDGGRARDGAPH